MKPSVVVLVTAAAMTVLSACGNEPSTSEQSSSTHTAPSSASPSASPEPVNPSPTPTSTEISTAVPSEVVNIPSDPNFVTLTISGGIDGRYTRILVTEAGKVTVTPDWNAAPVRYWLDKSEVESLQALVNAVEWEKVEGDYTGDGADLIQYALSHDGHTVNAEETVTPSEVGPLIGRLTALENLPETASPAPTPTYG